MNSKELRLLGEAYAAIQEGYGKKEEKEEKEEDCVPKSEKGEHNCAKKVCHEQFGQGTCIFGEHAEPDRNGFVSHYDVMFEHGIERAVPTSEMEILVSESHGGHSGNKKTMVAHYEAEGDMVDEGMGLVTGTAKAINTVLKPAGQTPEQEKKAVANLTRTMDTVAKPVKAGLAGLFKPVGNAPITAGGGTPDTAASDAKIRELARQRGTLKQDVDLFDIVKGHLMSEGYADTEEAALAIMANMSEEWKQSIVEQMTGGSTDSPSDENKSFTGEGPKKPKGWKPTGPKLKPGQRPGYAR